MPKIAASGREVYLRWEDGRNGNSDIYLNRSLDAGSTRLPLNVRLDTGSAPGAAYSSRPRVATAGGAFMVVWEDGRNGWPDIYENRSLDAGSTWLATDVRLDTGDAPGTSSSGPAALAVTATQARAAAVICSKAPAATTLLDTKWPPMPRATAPASR